MFYESVFNAPFRRKKRSSLNLTPQKGGLATSSSSSLLLQTPSSVMRRHTARLIFPQAQTSSFLPPTSMALFSYSCSP
jgi:hypothetical protein